MQLKFMLAAAAGLTIAVASSVQAAEIKLMSSLGMRVMLTDLIADFERTTGHKVTAAYGAPGPIKTRIADGEPVDVAVLPAPGLDDLVKQGKIVEDSKVILARSGMGVGIRVGAPKPDISTPEAFKRALLAAKSISYSDPAIGSPSGAHVVKVLERLGITEEMKAKSKPYSGPGYHTEFVAKGEIEISMAQISEILPVQGAELAGPLPADLQLTTVYQTGVGTATKDQAAAKAFITFLRSLAAAAVIKAKGMEPVTP